MEENYNWIKLNRKILDSQIWTSEPFSRGQAWVDLLLLANYTDSYYFIRGNKIDVKRGQLAWSIDKLAARWNWSKGKVLRYLKLLEIDKQIIQQKSFVITLISITNYDKYQANSTADDTADDTADSTADDTADGKADSKHNKKENKEKNENKEKKEKPQPLFNFLLRDGVFTDEEFLALPQIIQDTKEHFELWCKHRKTHKFRYTKKGALSMFTEQINKLQTKERLIKAIEFSIESDYAGIFEQKRNIDEIIYPIDLSNIHKNTTNENFIKFIKWVEKYYPRLNRMREPFTEEQFNALFPKYTRKQLEPFFTQINNSVFFYSKKFSPFSTILEEIQKQQNPK